MVRGKDWNTGESQQAIFFLTALFGLTFKREKKRIKTHTQQ